MRFIIYDDNVHAAVDLHARFIGKICKTALCVHFKEDIDKTLKFMHALCT